jgi:hypothetical protein
MFLEHKGFSEQHRVSARRGYDVSIMADQLTSPISLDYPISDIECPCLKRELLAINPMQIFFSKPVEKCVEQTDQF